MFLLRLGQRESRCPSFSSVHFAIQPPLSGFIPGMGVHLDLEGVDPFSKDHRSLILFYIRQTFYFCFVFETYFSVSYNVLSSTDEFS